MQINFAQIIFQIINFGVVMGALTYLMYKPILKTLQNRAKRIEEGQLAAEEVISEKAEIESLKQKATSQTKKEAATLLSEAKIQADDKKKELMTKANQEVKAYLEAEKAKWDVEKARLLKEMEGEFTSAVFQVVEKVLGKGVIDSKTHSKLIDESIKEITKAL